PEREQSFLEHVLKRLAIFLGLFGLRVTAILVDANGDAGHLLKQTGVEKMRQHAVEAIRDFGKVFEKENAVFEWRLKGSAEGGAKDGQVAADERAGGAAGAEDSGRRRARGEGRGARDGPRPSHFGLRTSEDAAGGCRL